jgi:hypothetical protein
MSWVACSQGQLQYTGRIDRGPFRAWAESHEGGRLVEALSRSLGLRFMGRQRAARRIWRELTEAARAESLVDAVEAELARYMQWLANLAYAEGLPRTTVKLQRLVIVPRVLLNGLAGRGIVERLEPLPALSDLSGGNVVRTFFVTRLVREIDAACAAAAPSLRRPLVAPEGWASVGVDSSFLWRSPYSSEPAWPGHHFMLELPRRGIDAPFRAAVKAGIESLQASLELSKIERDDILRRAAAFVSTAFATT